MTLMRLMEYWEVSSRALVENYVSNAEPVTGSLGGLVGLMLPTFEVQLWDLLHKADHEPSTDDFFPV